jgi:hypothetical protein
MWLEKSGSNCSSYLWPSLLHHLFTLGRSVVQQNSGSDWNILLIATQGSRIYEADSGLAVVSRGVEPCLSS